METTRTGQASSVHEIFETRDQKTLVVRSWPCGSWLLG